MIRSRLSDLEASQVEAALLRETLAEERLQQASAAKDQLFDRILFRRDLQGYEGVRLSSDGRYLEYPEDQAPPPDRL